MRPDDAARQIERLRRFRNALPRDVSIARDVERVRRDAVTTDRSAAKILDAWERMVPQDLRDSGRPTSFKRGVLEITCESSPAIFGLNRWLQAGGLDSLARAMGRPIGVVKFSYRRS